MTVLLAHTDSFTSFPRPSKDFTRNNHSYTSLSATDCEPHLTREQVSECTSSGKKNIQEEPALTTALYGLWSWFSSSMPPGKGFSQMDWLRLTKSGANLNGLGGKPLRKDITMEEVKRHKTKDDAWMVFNGLVYNITHYLKYHPGGIEILMKVAGRDGTSQFLKYHPYVNMRAMMEKCLIGSLKVDPLQSQIAAEIEAMRQARETADVLRQTCTTSGTTDAMVLEDSSARQETSAVQEGMEGSHVESSGEVRVVDIVLKDVKAPNALDSRTGGDEIIVEH
ncbi:hypothetical protein CEUSTIGMA_g2437.t1 [Chlamydomonas eustigma]|uniref:Cytochrome b5 heme-binding domain-containing protein n=1 Tax=Chlamydomonas eustigma TaxID=1157962 RepID=A0A250WVZ7_9CHLO|nr:hypothetical protein CEUSTIGMA_g2437.t1 [Chlamydomonas eustigma]|eukprot:GAX74991.1 hypothetical protein CEUSTIGMA_g2437.t1 [Chlamydomonas eustigma]